jgi:hypothetical protein
MTGLDVPGRLPSIGLRVNRVNGKRRKNRDKSPKWGLLAVSATASLPQNVVVESRPRSYLRVYFVLLSC